MLTDVPSHALPRWEDRTTRYAVRWRDAFDDAATPFLATNVVVLDIGSGRQPTISPEDRPAACRYVGFDISEGELELAGEDAYDGIVVGDIAKHDPSLAGRFDLALSWQVLEHVRPVDRAFANIYSYLRPGGVVVAQLSGKFSLFAFANQLVPRSVGLRLLHRLLGRDARTVFPAYYHRCYATALERTLIDWSDVRIVPRFRGASYFTFSPTVQELYLRYEDWAMRGGRDNLATHYLVVAKK